MLGSEVCQQPAVTNVMFIPWRRVAFDGDETIMRAETCALKLTMIRADASDNAPQRSQELRVPVYPTRPQGRSNQSVGPPTPLAQVECAPKQVILSQIRKQPQFSAAAASVVIEVGKKPPRLRSANTHPGVMM
jgi:hypothetical protein